MKNKIDDFINYFKQQKFVVIKKGYEIGKVDMEHDDSRHIKMYVSGNGLDFIITGYNFI